MHNSENIAKQYLNAQVNYDGIADAQDDLKSVKTVNLANEEALKEYEKFKQKLKVFNGLKSLSEAKETAKNVFNITNEINYYKAGFAKCVIINRANKLVIILDSDKELISYSFNQKVKGQPDIEHVQKVKGV